jgi:hypothetical protein
MRGKALLPLLLLAAVERPAASKKARSLCCCFGAGLACLGGTLKLAWSAKNCVSEMDAAEKLEWTVTSGRSHLDSKRWM